MNAPALETRALCKSFGALQVADAIDFRLERGRSLLGAFRRDESGNWSKWDYVQVGM